MKRVNSKRILVGGEPLAKRLARLTDEEMRKAEALAITEEAEFNLWVLPFIKENCNPVNGSKIHWKAGGRIWHGKTTGLGSLFLESGGLRVIVSGSREADERRWIHLSASRVDRLPNWPDMVYVKETFLGSESRAIQVFPPRSEWINDNALVLHLWLCLDDPKLIPDFRKEILGGISI